MNKEIDCQKLIDMNYRCLTLLGYASALISSMLPKTKADELKAIWFFKAVENIIYLDKPLPPMPEILRD